MKDIRPAIRALLLANPSLSTMVGGSRIYPVNLPQGTTSPSVVQNMITESNDYHNIGSTGLVEARIQIDCWAQSHDQAVQLSGLVFDVLSGFSGTVTWGTNSPPSDVLVRAIFADHGHDEIDDTAKLYARRRDFMVWHSET